MHDDDFDWSPLTDEDRRVLNKIVLRAVLWLVAISILTIVAWIGW